MRIGIQQSVFFIYDDGFDSTIEATVSATQIKDIQIDARRGWLDCRVHYLHFSASLNLRRRVNARS